MRRGTPLCWPLAVFLLLPGCIVLSPNNGCVPPPAPPVPANLPIADCGLRIADWKKNPQSPPVEGRTSTRRNPQSRDETTSLVFFVIGAGGWEDAYRATHDTAAEDGLPLDIRCFHWGHGFRRVVADQMHGSHMRASGARLAETVWQCQQECPGRPIYLIGHSAGCGVVLAAAEHLPPWTVERILLLAPAVSYKHDLRPALASARQGLDVFISDHDWGCLGLLVFLTGTTDRCWTLAAGRVGFRPIVTCPEDELLYAKLRQYPWNPSQTCLGHNGGHYGTYSPAFLRAIILPMLLPPKG